MLDECVCSIWLRVRQDCHLAVRLVYKLEVKRTSIGALNRKVERAEAAVLSGNGFLDDSTVDSFSARKLPVKLFDCFDRKVMGNN